MKCRRGAKARNEKVRVKQRYKVADCPIAGNYKVLLLQQPLANVTGSTAASGRAATKIKLRKPGASPSWDARKRSMSHVENCP